MEDNLEKQKHEVVLLVSGGLDSYLAYRLYQPTILLYCDLGHKYCERERLALSETGIFGLENFIYNEDFRIPSWEREDAIIPLRNLLLAAAASRYGDTIWLASLHGEINADKSEEFYQRTSELFSVCYQKSYWCEGRSLIVDSPVSGFTKAELIGRAMLSVGVTKEDIAKTVSCYHPDGFCGECSSCFKRAVATKLNGWVEDYKTNPLKTELAQECLFKAKTHVYGPRRAADIINAVEV